MTSAAILGGEISYAKQCGCCPECLADLPDHWLSDFWRYCPHDRVMSRRRSRSDRWTIDVSVSKRKASKHLAAAVKKMKAYAQAQGLDLATVDAMLSAYRLRDPDGR